MSKVLKVPQNEAPDDLEARLRKVSLLVSLVAVGLMVLGLVGMLLDGTPRSLPGGSVVPLPAFEHPFREPMSLVATSAGILLLAVLPSVRVLLALMLYAHQRGFQNALVALIVLLELIASTRGGG